MYVLVPSINEAINIDVKPEVLTAFESGRVSYTLSGIGVLSILGSILYFSNSIKAAEWNNENLVQSSAEKNNLMEANERKLNETLLAVQQARQEDEKRQWASEGLAQLAEILRASNQNSVTIYDRSVAFLVQYTQSNQGALFLEETKENTSVLKQVATYAYDRKKYIQNEIAIGDGLVGQTYLEKEYTYLTNIPNGYVHITSGLGESTPTALLLMPLKIEKEVHGVFEMASFKNYEEYKIQFVERACASLAVAVANIKISDQTKTLLEQTQQQAEEMHAQQEEMRQNMEELQATQEEMVRKSDELRQFMDAINRSSVGVLAVDTKGKIIDANSSILSTLGHADISNLTNKTIHDIGSNALQTQLETAGMWSGKEETLDIKGEFELKNSSGEPVTISGSIVREISGKGKHRISMIGVDISANKRTQEQLQQNEQKIKLLLKDSNKKNLEVNEARHQLEKAAKEVEEKIQALNEAEIGVLELRVSGTIMSVNKFLLELLGYTQDELVGKSYKILYPKEFNESTTGLELWSKVRNSDIKREDYERISKDGSKIRLKSSYSILYDNDGLPQKIVCFCMK